MGGSIAVKMAAILMAQGESDEGVVMMDSVYPERLSQTPLSAKEVDDLATKIWEASVKGRMAHLVEAMHDGFDDEADNGIGFGQKVDSQIQYSIKLLSSVKPKTFLIGFIDTSIVLVRCTSRGYWGNIGPPQENTDGAQTLGWSPEQFRNFTMFELDAGHGEVVDPRNADNFTKIMRKGMDELKMGLGPWVCNLKSELMSTQQMHKPPSITS